MNFARTCLLLLPLALLGCDPGFGEKDVVGTWTGQVEVEDIMAQEDLSPVARELMKGIDGVALTVTYSEDKTYTFDVNLGFIALNGNGNWSVEEEKVTMQMTTMSLGNRAIELKDSGFKNPVHLTPSEDRKTMTGQVEGRSGQFVLTKVEAPAN